MTDLNTALNSLTAAYQEKCLESKQWLAGQPQSIDCKTHRLPLPIVAAQCVVGRPVYAPCPLCLAECAELETQERLRGCGIPRILCRATFDNWVSDSEQDASVLDQARSFARARRGFLLLLGPSGTGKSHLGVAITRQFKQPLFVKQSELLRRLRATYRDKAAVDPVEHAQNADLLVLDEVGLSPGGRDELPLLHDVLDHRHSELKPTVLTGNLDFDALESAVGVRMRDRLRESTFAILHLGGESRRGRKRDDYFGGCDG